MTMSELTHIGLAGLGDGPPAQPQNSASYLRWVFVWLPVALIAGLGAWALVLGDASKPADSEPTRLAVAGPAPPSIVAPEPLVPAFDPPTAGGEAITPEETAPVDRLKISSQHWRRGGLGSNALVTFTVRNSNDYAVRDIAISCAFSRRDGSHLTDRTRVIHDTVDMRSRKIFARMHVGFVNVNAAKAKCSLVGARHI